MKTFRAMLTFAGLGMAILSGCGGAQTDSTGVETQTAEQELKYCTSNSQCPSGQYCINSACRIGSDEPIICGDITCADGKICCVNNWTCNTTCATP
ncbi:hypothetical protein LY474_00945 [Myxococcus stipitatus]|uniref:hypothetical protein n=1 Tax=Myxococcus stipitatus TaxID=83455 RepID=UPI001F3CE2CE|nr:hypothetical protein [Myxococcus stipitatus]MCE9666364.1 hypothetical protein [Myxococcus stipitatus]